MPKLNLMNPLFFFYLSFFFFYLLSSSLNVGGAADGRPWFTPKAFVGGAAVADENSFTPKAFVSRYWNKQMANGMQMANGPPWFLLNKASPLTAEESATFSKLADEDQNALSTRLQSFCSSANLLCFSAIDKYVANYGTHPLAVNTYTCTFSYTCGGKAVNKSVEPGLFFRERMLKTGTVMPMPDIRDKMPKRSFLPRAISSKLPFSMSKLPEMNRFFHAGENSSMDSMFASVVSECERAPNAGETKRCVRSIEDMIDSRAHRLGQTKQVTVYRLITRGTIEERIRKRALQKEEVQRVVISGGAGVDFNTRSRENRTKDMAMWLADDDQAAEIEKREAELAAQEASAPPGKKRRSAKRKADVSLDEMYHEGEGHFDDGSAKPSGTATPVSAIEGPTKRRKGISKKAKTIKQRLAVADGQVDM